MDTDFFNHVTFVCVGPMKHEENPTSAFWLEQIIILKALKNPIAYNLGRADAIFTQNYSDIFLLLFQMFKRKSAVFFFLLSGGMLLWHKSFTQCINYIVFHFEDKHKEIWPKMKGNKISKICIYLSGHMSKGGVINICSIRIRQGNKDLA